MKLRDGPYAQAGASCAGSKMPTQAPEAGLAKRLWWVGMKRTASATTAVIARLTGRERLMLAALRGDVMQPGDQLAALVEAARALGQAHMPYALIGGIAVGIRTGLPRATMDVDLAVATAIERADVAAVLVAAGFELRGEYAHSLNFRHDTGEPLQVAFDPTFDLAIDRAEPITIGDVRILVVDRADLIRMKERAAAAAAADPSRRRSKALRDLADVELLSGDVPDDDEGW